jgi:hypothetical protein
MAVGCRELDMTAVVLLATGDLFRSLDRSEPQLLHQYEHPQQQH